ncbi:MAG TPA: iron-sulfur cluster assembly accessory protein [Actinomycetota bacterium]|nr:iron-sulfur cluster assembly accessory protein [Actinomycetota bacterium]
METSTTTSPSTTDTATETEVKTIGVTQAAARKISELLAAEANPAYFLRVGVQPGGCSGLRYAIYFDDEEMAGDVVSTPGDFTVRVDRMSNPYLIGSTLDWLERLDASGFTVDNPNAQGSCACGESFH